MLQFGRQNEGFTPGQHSAVRAVGGTAVLICSVLAPSPASGFCRTRTCEFERLDNRSAMPPCERDPDTLCALSSHDTYWDALCLALSVHSEGSAVENISAEHLREHLDAAIEQWLQIDCGAAPHLGAFVRGITACDQLEFACSRSSDGQPPGYGANENLVVFRDGPSQLAFEQVALTTVTANLETGRVLDADIELNSRYHDFVLRPQDAQGEAYLLRTVLSHEFGHVLGLSHSLKAGALMGVYGSQSAQPGEDDREGFCAIWGSEGQVSCVPPERSPMVCVGSDTDCPPQIVTAVKSAGCACSVPGQGAASRGATAGLSALSVLLLTALRRRLPRLGRSVRAVGLAIVSFLSSGCLGHAAQPRVGVADVQERAEAAGEASLSSRTPPSSRTKRCVPRRGRRTVDTLGPGGGLALTPFRPHHGLLGSMRCE